MVGYGINNILTAVGHRPTGISTDAHQNRPVVNTVQHVVRNKKNLVNSAVVHTAERKINGSKLQTPTAHALQNKLPVQVSKNITDAQNVADRNYVASHVPHQWKKPDVPEFKGGHDSAELFSEMNGDAKHKLRDQLLARGYSNADVDAAFSELRNDDLKRAMKNPALMGRFAQNHVAPNAGVNQYNVVPAYTPPAITTSNITAAAAATAADPILEHFASLLQSRGRGIRMPFNIPMAPVNRPLGHSFSLIKRPALPGPLLLTDRDRDRTIGTSPDNSSSGRVMTANPDRFAGSRISIKPPVGSNDKKVGTTTRQTLQGPVLEFRGGYDRSRPPIIPLSSTGRRRSNSAGVGPRRGKGY